MRGDRDRGRIIFPKILFWYALSRLLRGPALAMGRLYQYAVDKLLELMDGEEEV